MSNIKNYKGALINYFCNDCQSSDDFFVEFSDVPKVKPGGCVHFNINFIYAIEKYDIKYLLSFTCKKYKESCMKELFNKNTKNIDGNIKYKCSKCGQGDIIAGFYFSNEMIDLDNPKSINQEFQNCINLIFRYNNKQYSVSSEIIKSIPEVYYKLCQERKEKELEDLDILRYKKGDDELSQFKSLEELNLKSGDVIDIEIRPYSGWD